MASHTHDASTLSHQHDFLENAQLAFHFNLNVLPFQQSFNSAVKLYLIYPFALDDQQWPVTDFHSQNKPYYQEALHPILYIRTLIDPPKFV